VHEESYHAHGHFAGDGTAGKITEEEETFDIIWPVIITEAPLFEARLSAEGDIVTEPVTRGVL